MNGIVHPFSGALYEQDGEGNILVTDGDTTGTFTILGKWISGELRECGHRGVQALLEMLAAEPAHGISAVLSCLEYCWDERALEPVRDRLASDEADVRKAAAELLDRTVGRRTLARYCDGLTAHENTAVADFAALHAEPAFPDAERMLRFARRGAGRARR